MSPFDDLLITRYEAHIDCNSSSSESVVSGDHYWANACVHGGLNRASNFIPGWIYHSNQTHKDQVSLYLLRFPFLQLFFERPVRKRKNAQSLLGEPSTDSKDFLSNLLCKGRYSAIREHSTAQRKEYLGSTFRERPQRTVFVTSDCCHAFSGRIERDLRDLSVPRRRSIKCYASLFGCDQQCALCGVSNYSPIGSFGSVGLKQGVST